jgi:bacterioferritin
VKGNPKVISALNELLRLELGAVNQYVAHSRMCANWGYERLAKRFRDISLDEMKDAEGIIDRILFLEGVPDMRQPEGIAVGKTVTEQYRAALESERRAIELLSSGVAAALEAGDQASREFFASRLPEEEAHVDWLETQLSLIEEVGEPNYLSQQLRE